MDEPAAGPNPPPRRSWPRRVLNRLEVDRAVFYAIAQRGWQFLAGPITLLLVARYFTADIQGYYYTFWSILALQVFFELALPQTIITTASHQWRGLALSQQRRIVGDADSLSRLAHLTRVSLALFTASGTIFFAGVGLFGLWFFAREPISDSLSWRGPWIALIVLSALTFITTPLLSVLEGCNRVADVYKLQMLRAVIGNAVVWVTIPMGLALWIPALVTFVRLACEAAFLLIQYRHFFTSIFTAANTATIAWRTEVWPFQYRILLKGLLSYFNADLMGPVVFHYHGAVWAGQLGMTWQILSALRGACSSWVRARYAQMGILVAGRDYQELDRVFFRVATIGAAVMLVAGATFCALVLALRVAESPYAVRLLPAGPTALLTLGLLAALGVEFLWTYIHSHRVSPYLSLTFGGSILSGVLIWAWGAWYGRTGVAAAFCVVHLGLYLPLSLWAWRHLRIQWQQAEGVDLSDPQGNS